MASVQFSHSVRSDSLRPHELQHPRPLCPSPTPGVHSDSHPSSRWCHPAISSSVVPFSSCPQSLPASESFLMSQLFSWGGQSTGVSALASFFPKNTQDQSYSMSNTVLNWYVLSHLILATTLYVLFKHLFIYLFLVALGLHCCSWWAGTGKINWNSIFYLTQELELKEGWASKNWCFWTVVLEKTLESPLDSKEIKPVNPKENQSWI